MKTELLREEGEWCLLPAPLSLPRSTHDSEAAWPCRCLCNFIPVTHNYSPTGCPLGHRPGRGHSLQAGAQHGAPGHASRCRTR